MATARTKKEVLQAVDVHDLHFPKHNKPTLDCVLDYCQKNPPDVFIFGGDQFHFDCISHHTDDKPLYRTRKAYLNDIQGFEEKVLEPLEALLPETCEKVWIIGNHERFEFDLIERHPELEGAIDHIKLLGLIERKWKIIPLGHCYRLGKLNIIHGEVLTGFGNQGPAYPSRKATELYASSVLAGHTHSAQTYTKISPVEKSNKWQGHISPCACDVNPGYLRNRPTNWINGFNVIDVFSNGNFSYYPIIVSGGRFSLAGKIYGAK